MSRFWAVVALVWAMFLCLLYTFGGEAGQTAANNGAILTFVLVFLAAMVL